MARGTSNEDAWEGFQIICTEGMLFMNVEVWLDTLVLLKITS